MKSAPRLASVVRVMTAMATLVLPSCTHKGETNPPDDSDVDAGVDQVDAAKVIDAKAAQDRAPTKDTAVASKDARIIPDRPTCKQAGAFFCEDFESGALDDRVEAVWSADAKNTAGFDSTRPRNGSKYSLHVKSDLAESYVSMALPNPIPAGVKTFYLRSFVYTAAPTSIYNFYLFGARGNLTDPNKTEAYGMLGSISEAWGTPGAKQLTQLAFQPNDEGERSTHDIPLGRWACWEWLIDGAKNEWRAWIDGVEQVSTAATAGNPIRWVVPPVTLLQIGIIHAHLEPNPLEVWFDDLVLGTKPIGCN